MYTRMWDGMNRIDPNEAMSRSIKELKPSHLITPSATIQPARVSVVSKHDGREQMRLDGERHADVITRIAMEEGHRSWIWETAVGVANASTYNNIDYVDQFLRAEWVRSKALMDWWVEEVTVVNKEMRIVLVYFLWKRHWWPEVGDSSRTGLSKRK